MGFSKGHESLSEMANGAPWFILDQSCEQGPLSWDSLLFKKETGELSTEALVWTEGLSDWILLRVILEQKHHRHHQTHQIKPDSPRPLGSPITSDTWAKRWFFHLNRFRLPIGISLATVVVGMVWILPEQRRLEEVEASLTQDDFRAARAIILQPKIISETPLISIGKDNPRNPSVYFFSKVPDQTEIEIRLVGIRGSLLNRPHYDQTQIVRMTHQMGRTMPFTDLENRPLARGIYTITASLKHEKTPISKRSYFIGGPRDAAFETELAHYNQKLSLQRSAEQSDLKQYLSTLETQLSDTNQHFHEAMEAMKSKSNAGVKTWRRHLDEWATLQDQLGSVFNSWTEGAIDRDFFYYEHFTHLKVMASEVRALHQEQSDFITQNLNSPSSNPSTKAISKIFDLESELQGKIMDLRNKIKQASSI